MTETTETGAVAEDESGCVQAHADEACFIRRIRISALWREKLEIDQVARAVTQACVRAIGNAGQGAGRPLAEAITDGASTGARPSGSLRHMTPEKATEAMYRLAGLCDSVLTEASREMDLLRDAAGREYAGSDQRKRVRVDLDMSGVVRMITMDQNWLAGVSTERLTETILEAFHSAYEALATAKERFEAEASATHLFQRLRTDPDTLCHWLGGEE